MNQERNGFDRKYTFARYPLPPQQADQILYSTETFFALLQGPGLLNTSFDPEVTAARSS
jgi:hypothetical protein